MPSGRLAAVDMSAGVNTLIYTPGGRAIDLTVAITNRNDSDVKIRLAVAKGDISTLVIADHIEYDVTIRANGLIRADVSVSGRQSIIGYSDTGNVNFQVWS